MRGSSPLLGVSKGVATKIRFQPLPLHSGHATDNVAIPDNSSEVSGDLGKAKVWLLLSDD